jgi:hypothetical protein
MGQNLSSTLGEPKFWCAGNSLKFQPQKNRQDSVLGVLCTVYCTLCSQVGKRGSFRVHVCPALSTVGLRFDAWHVTLRFLPRATTMRTPTKKTT